MRASDKPSSNRYRTAKGVEGEFEPGYRGCVLANKLGIVSKTAMNQMEFAALVRAQEKYLLIVTTETIFSAELVRMMHREWLGKWGAGKRGAIHDRGFMGNLWGCGAGAT
ncbi:MAG: hypothetical protein HKL95_02270 [Phycisphaerae bacterium]|nr:hypothetical protein [Phycisphaerae bacterium]